MMKVIRSLLCIGIVLLFCACAQVVALSGGAPDRTPPKVLNTSPLQNSVSFTEPTITLEFNEYIQVIDAANELFISPRLKELPDLTVKGKKLIIDFKDQKLLPNTTYHLSFGKAIADMNERNVLEGYEFTFSTGAHIDSLRLSGELLQAEDNQAAASMLVGLYSAEVRTDSLPYKTEPIYICRGSKTGQFTFNHLPAGNYQVFAIDDKNKNYLYDGDQERIAFYSENLQLTADSSIQLHVFKETSARHFIAKTISPNYGRAFIILNKPFNVALRPLYQTNASKIQIVPPFTLTDSIEVYYKELQDTLALIAELPDNSGLDTLFVKLPRVKKRVLQAPEVVFTPLSPNKTDRISLKFITWMDTLVKPKLKLKSLIKNDSSAIFKSVDGHWLDTRNYQIHQALQPGTIYQIIADSAAFSDLNRNSNDSLAFSIKTKAQSDFGKLLLKIRFNIKQNYQIELLNEQGKVAAKRSTFFSLSSSNVASLEFSDLQPGIYRVRIIYDTNENGKWDGGNLLKRVQPEKISVLSKQIKVISDWELEENLEEK